MAVHSHPISAALGLEITGMTSNDLVTRAGADAAQAALDRHGVVVYREVNINDEGLLELSRMLGTLVVQPTGEHRNPEIQTITLDPAKTNALLASYRQGNFHWHIDGATDETPQKGTLLTARAVDPAGGDTEFLQHLRRLRGVARGAKAQICGLQVVHTFAHAQSLANPDATEEQRAQWNRVPARIHPLVWTHRDGRKSMLLGATADEVVGWPPARSREMLDRLLDWSTQPQFSIRHQWRVGDLVMWDNTGMLHRALPFEPTSVRLMHRTTLAGEEPVAAA